MLPIERASLDSSCSGFSPSARIISLMVSSLLIWVFFRIANPAAALGGFSLFPQLLKVLKTKSTKDISREMFLILACSILLWLIYGILLKNFPLIIANSFGFIQAIIILFYKIKNQMKKRT
jgi:MtN3 and saliva related transmembrane protein